MPEKCVRKTPDVFSADYSGICRCDPFGKYFADASGFLFGQSADAISWGTFYSHFGSMRYRTCSKGQRKLLVCIRTDSYSCAYTNRWTWSSNRSGSGFASFREKISLMQRSTMQDAISAPKVGGIVRLTRFILKGTLLIEAAGAMLLLPVLYRIMA